MLVILIIGLTAGPAVSLYGSPTVSPVTAALCASEPLPPKCPSSMYFFALSHAPPPLVLTGPSAAEVSVLDVLLRVVPRAAAGGHRDGDEQAGNDGAHQEAAQ